MSKSTKFSLTEHAVDRYIERFAPGLSKDRARRALSRLAAGARPLKVKVASK
jgi:hypothetical protein